MKQSIFILSLFSLTHAVWLNAALASETPSNPIEPDRFLADKPIRATLTVPSLSADSRVQLLPGGPYQSRVEHFDQEIGRIKVSGDFRYIFSKDHNIVAHHLDDKSIEPRIIGDSEEIFSTFDVNENLLLAMTDAGQAQMFALDSQFNVPISFYDTNAAIVQAELTQQFAFLLSQTGTLFILDISDPKWPMLTAEYSDAPQTLSFVHHNGLIWLVAGKAGLIVLDTLNPFEPQVIANFQTRHAVKDIALLEDLAVLTTGLGGITVLDTQEPAQLRWLASHSKLGDTQKISSNEFMQIAVSNQRNQIFHLDLSLPNQPSVLNTLRSQEPIQAMKFSGTELAIFSEHNIAYWDMSSEQPLLSNENLNMGEGVNFGGQRKGFVENDILYVADWFSGIHLYDIRQKHHPRLLSSYHTPGSPKGVVVKNNIAYIADDDHGLHLVDVSNPTQPETLSQLQTQGLAYTPVIDGDLLYLASHHGGFQIIDISDAFQPRLIGEYDTPGKAWFIAVKNKIAYVADDESGLLIFDTSAPNKPKLIGHFNPGGQAEDVFIDGNIAYVAFFDQGIYVLDISDPKAPQSLSHLPTPGNARGLDKQGFVLYVADWLGGVHAINVANPKHPKLIGSYDTEGAAWGLKTVAHYTYVFDWWGGLNVLDVKHPADIRKAGDYQQRNIIHQLSARNNYIFAAQGSRGLQVYDIKNPLNPTWVTGEEIQGNVVDFAIAENKAYLAAEEGGLAIVNISNPFSPQLLSQTRHLEPISQVKYYSDIIYAQDRLGNILGFDASQPSLSDVLFQLDLQPGDFQVDNEYLLVAQDNELLSYSLRHGIPHQANILDLDHPITLIRFDGQTALAVDTTNTLHVIELAAGIPVLLTSIQLKHDIVDVLIDAPNIHITTKKAGVFNYQFDPDNVLTLMAHYPLLSNIDGLYAYRHQLYGMGENFVLAINKLPDITLEHSEEENLIYLDIPQGLVNGAYDLVVEQNETSQRYENALTTAYFGITAPQPVVEPPQDIAEETTEQPEEIIEELTESEKETTTEE